MEWQCTQFHFLLFKEDFQTQIPPPPVQCCTGINAGSHLANSTLFGGRGYILVGKGDFKARYAKKIGMSQHF